MSIFFADQMCHRVLQCQKEQQRQHQEQREQHQSNNQPVPNERRRRHASASSQKFSVTPEICTAINNVDYVLEFVRLFITEQLGTEETLEKLRVTSGAVVATSCRRTLTTLVVNTVDNVENKILEVLDIIGERVRKVTFIHTIIV
jgi:hypothetical protein